MTEIIVPEPARAPEKMATYTAHLGLQGRLAMGGEALFPAKTVDLKVETIADDASAVVSLIQKASIRERTEATKNVTLDAWKASVVTKIQKIPKSTLGRDHAEFFEKMGIDTAKFSDDHAQALYDRYFSAAHEEHGLEQFLTDVTQAYENDIPSLRKNLTAVQWMAGLFGNAHSNELIANLFDVKRTLDPDNKQSFIDTCKDHVNALSDKEKSHLAFLVEEDLAANSPTKVDVQPATKQVNFTTDTIITINEEDLERLKDHNTKLAENVSLGQDSQGNDISVHLGFPDQKDAAGHNYIFPNEPHVFVVDNLTVTDKKHPAGEVFHNMCVVAAHGIRTPDGTWRFANQQDVQLTVIKYNDYAKANELPPIEFIMACNATGEEEVNITAINTGNGTIVQSDHASIRVNYGKDDTTHTIFASAAIPDGEFIGYNELMQRKGKKEIASVAEIDTHIKHAAEYLLELDEEAARISIDEKTGKIAVPLSPPSPVIRQELKEYNMQFEALQNTFEARNQKCLTDLKGTKGVLDAQLYMGALVVTYDSSKNTPSGISYASFDDAKNQSRGGYERTTEKNLGIVMIDINSNKRRTDKVSPTVSAIHELQHHALAMTDYLLTMDSKLPLASGYRRGRCEPLFGDQIINKSDDLFMRDSHFYEKISNITSLEITDVENIRKQLLYLDELHASFMQKKQNWFNASNNVYATANNGKHKHWELVGRNQEDIEASKHIFTYIQGMEYMARVRDSWEKNPTPAVTTFIAGYDAAYRKAGALIGAGRSIQQVERLLHDEWEALKTQYPVAFNKAIHEPSFKATENKGSLPGATVFLFG